MKKKSRWVKVERKVLEKLKDDVRNANYYYKKYQDVKAELSEAEKAYAELSAEGRGFRQGESKVSRQVISDLMLIIGGGCKENPFIEKEKIETERMKAGLQDTHIGMGKYRP